MSNHAFQNKRKLKKFARTLGEIMDIPQLVISYRTLLIDYRTTMIDTGKKIAMLKVQESNAVGTNETWRLVMEQDNTDYRDKVFDITRRIIGKTVEIAEKLFAGNADKLKIESQNYVEMFMGESKHKADHEKILNLDLYDVWGQLTKDFGNGKGETEAYSQYATQIIRAFDLRQGDDIKIIGGNIVLEKTMHLDSIDKKYGKNRYGYSCKSDLTALLDALNKFFKWAGKTDYIHPTNVISNQLNDSHRIVEPREKFMISDEVYFITMNSKLDFRFSQSLGFLLQQFVTEFGELRLARAA